MIWEDIVGAAEDSVGAGVVTAGEAKALIARIDADMQRLDDTIQAANVGKQFRRGWEQFRHSWRTFFYEEKDYPSRLAGRSALMFVNEAKQWRQALEREKAARVSGEDVGPGVAPSRVIKDDMQAVRATISQLDSDIMSSDVRNVFKKAWRMFVGQWQRLYESNRGGGTNQIRGVADKVPEYRVRTLQWLLAFERERSAAGIVGRGLGASVATQSLGRHEIGGIGGPRVDAAMKLVTTAEGARALLDTAEKHLSTASERIAQVPLVAAAAGLRQALRDGVDNVRNWTKKVRPQLPAGGPLTDETLRRKVALAVVQAEDQLKRVDDSVNDPELRFGPNFANAMKQIVTTAESSLPLKPILLGVGGLIVLGAVVRRVV